MAYTEHISNHIFRPTANPLSVAATSATLEEYAFFDGANVRQFSFMVTTAVTGSAATLVLYKRSAPGITTGQVAVATLTIPVGAAAGTIVYKLLDSADVLPGQALAVAVTAAGTAGAGLISYSMYHDPEVPMNVSVCVQSA